MGGKEDRRDVRDVREILPDGKLGVRGLGGGQGPGLDDPVSGDWAGGSHSYGQDPGRVERGGGHTPQGEQSLGCGGGARRHGAVLLVLLPASAEVA